ncbi:hypothetical protein BTN49_3145 [Candidatus Enterovibrio escicola]|uniref:Uncharacterized protein n=1 Tax=Candidatus Enterovibrio escicola TaxID=1927127 RepID=A0A2A5SZB6_9GAMM|nr:hypothetical protein BTN49_3145 [Candidatus Enterovibrio escacola]
MTVPPKATITNVGLWQMLRKAEVEKAGYMSVWKWFYSLVA